MANLTAFSSKQKNSISIENNSFIQKIQIPSDFWSFTLSQFHIDDLPFEMDLGYSENTNNLYLFKSEKVKNIKGAPLFLRTRTDWNIKQGDYIIKDNKKIKQRIFTKKDLKNLFENFWLIIFSSLIVYYILVFVGDTIY